jgi:hypothetical protein
MSTGASQIGSTPQGGAEYPRHEGPMDMAPATARKAGGRVRRLALAVTAAAGLLAFCAPVAAQASARPAAVPGAARTARPTATAATAQGLVVGQLNPSTAAYVNLAAPYTGCTLWIGDRYEGAGGAAVGMAEIQCPTYHTYRVQVYLAYQTASGPYFWQQNLNGTPIYGTGSDVWTGCGRNLSASYTTYARVSIDGSSYSPWWYGQTLGYSAGPNCP